MLWTEITSLVTRDGKTLSGTAVRDWLKERRKLPSTYAKDQVVIETSADPKVEIRTRDEIRAWLADVQLCSQIKFAEPPRGNLQNRQSVRGGSQQNRNNLPLRIEFFRQDGKATTREALVQGATLQVEARLLPAPGQKKRTFEISFIGAKIRSRQALRAVVSPNEVYRYLSRVRVARNTDGIRSPLLDMHRSFVTRTRTPTKKHRKHLVADDLTILGLEAGTELIQVALVNGDGSIECSAVLQIDVSLAPDGVGALRIYKNTTVDHFKAADPEFDKVYSKTTNSSDTVKVGVCDTGVYDDDAGEKYLSSRWLAGKYFDSATGIDADRDTKPSGLHAQHILTESPSMHGTNVAGQAVWGTQKIKLLDVMVQRGQETGLITDDAATRAFTWARDQGATVVNCSKILPFSKPNTNDFVKDGDTESKVLFLATGGNTAVSFPLHRAPGKPIPGEIPADFLPCWMINTLWVGGCKIDRTPHDHRGHGPAIEVMVPSNDPTVYSPRDIRQAFRALQIDKFRRDVLADLQGLADDIVNPPQTIAGSLGPVQRMQLQKLEELAPTGGPDLTRLNELRLRAANAPNPEYYKKQAYTLARAEVDSWAYDRANNVQVVAWATNILQMVADLVRDDAAAVSAFVQMRGVQGAARTALYEWLRNRVQVKNIQKHKDELAKAMQDASDISTDDGVSFGLPVVANIAAKLKLINKSLTPNQLKRILIDTSDIDPGFESQCVARGIVNPLRAYLAALDGEVSTGGTPHHDYAPVKDNSIEERRRIYYTFFYMDSQGRDLYDSIKTDLKSHYHAMNIDLVEAEPPVRIKSEAVTYVEGRIIQGHDWKKIVPVQHHPLTYAPKHLRLILVNQAASVERLSLAGDDTEYTVSYNTGNSTWNPEPVPAGKVIIGSALLILLPKGNQWACNAQLDDAHTSPRHAFAALPQHVVTKFTVLKDGDQPFDERRPPSEIVEVRRLTDRRVTVVVKDPLTNQRIQAEGRKIKIEFGVVLLIGGARKGRNIFVNNNYHAGNAGTPDAESSARVLFEHEIGHALGMVPEVDHAHYYNNREPQKTPPPDLQPIQDGKTGYGGDGEHCAFNTEDKPRAEATNHGVPNDAKSDLVKIPAALTDPLRAADAPCVMYHTRTAVHFKSVFCGECTRVLRGGALENKWSWNSDQ